MFGILNINKPKGLTSFDVVARLRKILKIKQIGHMGTLDPIAQGVLPICVGNATRLIEFFPTGKKYRAFMMLGVETDSYDLEGEELSRQQVILDREKLDGVIKNYVGEIEQTPPVFSAVHHNGKRLYEYARQKIEVSDIPKRKILIKSVEIKDFVDVNEANPIVVFDVECSSGTYIRSLIHDIGLDMSCGAVMSDLIRLKSGDFSIEDSLTLEEVESLNSSGELNFINPVDKIPFEAFELSDETYLKIKNGQSLNNEKYTDKTMLKLLYSGNLAAIAEAREGKILPKKVFQNL